VTRCGLWGRNHLYFFILLLPSLLPWPSKKYGHSLAGNLRKDEDMEEKDY
jgi:hypothetical protein